MEWISVNERMPKNGDVIIFVPDSGITVKTAYYLNGYFYTQVDNVLSPTHWMPLPEPPDQPQKAS